jgi:pimeloyl-ACP methyl ester carboxylesterase
VFLISGEKDVVVPMSQSLLMRDQLTNGDFLILAETGHMGFVERPELCFSFIKAFLKNNCL